MSLTGQRKRHGSMNASSTLMTKMISTLMKDAPFRRVSVLRPLLLQMDQRALPGAKQHMLQRRKRDQANVIFHTSRLQLLFDIDTGRQGLGINEDTIITVVTSRGILLAFDTLDFHAIEQDMRRGIAHWMIMLEDDQLA